MSIEIRPNPATAGGVTGGLTYKGSYNATTNTPDLTSSVKGDFYIVSVAGTLAGVTLNVGDHIVFNQDASSPITSAMFDVIDNTDAVSSVNGETGIVVLDLQDINDVNATLTPSDSTFLVGDGSEWIGESGATARTSLGLTIGTDVQAYDAQLDDVAGLTPADGAFIVGDGTNFVTETLGTARTSLGLGSAATEDVGTGANNVVQLDGSSRLPAVDGSQLTNLPGGSDTLDDVVGRGATTATSIQTGGLTVTGDIDPNADDTYFIGDENNRFISYYGDVNGAIRFKAKNDSGGTLNKGEVVYIKGINGTVPTVDKARANASGTMPAFGLVFANANDQAEVQIITFGNLNDFNTSTFSAGDTVFVSSATAGALVNTAPTGESNFIQNIGRVVRSDASAGIIKVGGAGRTNATPNLDQNKVFLGNASNQAVSTALSSIALSGFNNDAFLEIANNLNDLNNAATARTNLGVAIGTDVQAYDAQLADIAGMTPTDSNFIVGDGSNFVLESGATARTSLGLAIGTDVQAYDAQLADIAGLTPTDGNIIIGNGTNFITESGATARTSLGLSIGSDVQAYDAQLADVAGLTPADGAFIVGDGTNFVTETLGTARTSLGLGTVATLDVGTGANNVVQLDGSSRLPAVDGSQLTNLPGGGGSVPTTTAVSQGTDYTISTSTGIEEIFFITPTADINVNLPAASTAGDGYKYNIKNLASGFTLTIDPNSTETIDGATTFAISTQYQSITIVSDGSNWFII
jgi:hypothetical protein